MWPLRSPWSVKAPQFTHNMNIVTELHFQQFGQDDWFCSTHILYRNMLKAVYTVSKPTPQVHGTAVLTRGPRQGARLAQPTCHDDRIQGLNGLMLKRCNSSANALELHLFRINPSILRTYTLQFQCKKDITAVQLCPYCTNPLIYISPKRFRQNHFCKSTRWYHSLIFFKLMNLCKRDLTWVL